MKEQQSFFKNNHFWNDSSYNNKTENPEAILDAIDKEFSFNKQLLSSSVNTNKNNSIENDWVRSPKKGIILGTVPKKSKILGTVPKKGYNFGDRTQKNDTPKIGEGPQKQKLGKVPKSYFFDFEKKLNDLWKYIHKGLSVEQIRKELGYSKGTWHRMMKQTYILELKNGGYNSVIMEFFGKELWVVLRGICRRPGSIFKISIHPKKEEK